MSTYETLKTAVENGHLIQARVRLLNGERRLRLGPVANLNRSHVTIYDIGKGFRTTPISLVREVKDMGETELGRWYIEQMEAHEA